MMETWLKAVAISAPGLPDWQCAQLVLRGEDDYALTDVPRYSPPSLPANERRRAPPAVRQAFRSADAACAAIGGSPADYATVFASSDTDTAIIDRIARAVAAPRPVVSPTDFHNSVHNAASGYWGIASGSQLPSTTICAFDASAVAGLLEAAALTMVDGIDTLLVAYDVPMPEILRPKRQIDFPASIALILEASPSTRAIAALQLEMVDQPETKMENPALEALRPGNPATRLLPLLQVLAEGQPGRVILPMADTAVAAQIEPVACCKRA